MRSFVIELALWIIFSGYCTRALLQARKKRIASSAIIKVWLFYTRYMIVKKACK